MEFLPCILRLLTLHMSLFLSPGACLEPYDEELHSLLSPSLTHYTTLHPHSLTHTLHGSQSQPSHSRLVEFHTLERHFQLYLRPNYRIFSSGFKVRSVDRHGNLKEHEVDRTEYYQGVMGGEEGSIVNAHISESGLMTASVTTPTETYHFEPSDNFLTKPHPPHMIAYRSSDIKRDRFNQTRFDFVVAPPLPPGVQTETTANHQTDHTETIANYQRDHAQTIVDHKETVVDHTETVADHQRLKRQSRIGGSSCPMFLVVDHRFYNQFRGDGQDLTETIAGIARRLITLVAQVDSSIYRPAEWVLDPISGNRVSDFGLEIAEILVHHEPSLQDFFANSTTYYNNPDCCGDIRKTLDADGLLSAFNYGSWDGYCLAHLFTFVNFDSGLLGLANIASSFQSQTGGVCSKGFTDSSVGKRIIYNTGISSFTSGGIPIIRGEQILVVAHEVGHNWGSHHDPGNDPECSESYLMNEFAQDGSESSHSMFSICSRTSIGQVLRSKATCFRDPDPCGNFLIDDVTEQCDEGPISGPCCTPDCQLRDGAMCSDTNSACCTECEIASEDVVCNEAGDFSTNCSIDIHCNGRTSECPNIDTTNMAPHGSSCLIGRCRSIGNNLTECVDFCTFNGTTNCTCPSQDDECKLCCQREGGACEVSEDNINLPTGFRCSTGFCIGGECRELQDTISRVFSFITNLDVDDFGKQVCLAINIVPSFVVVYSFVYGGEYRRIHANLYSDSLDTCCSGSPLLL
ncbi:ADAM 17-like protease [Geodia barretti]|uniref:ADAM 17-like protease n=1 Tax=Geodia barretti TaxID=519541 RepID=A0AA35TKV6_GEOBA|nr:ADAM 17-like protease [Geodia barretti]